MGCEVCGLPTPSPPITGDDGSGPYCCTGCRAVAERLTAAPTEAEGNAADALDTGDPEAAGEETFLRVDGMHCATCETFLEAVATDADGVRDAEASYPTGTMRVVYDPDAVSPEAVPEVVDGFGYRASLAAASETEDHELAGRLIVGGFFGMMTMLWYALFLYPAYLGVDPATLLLDPTGSAGTYLLANIWLMTTVVLGYTGWPILRGAIVSLRTGHPNMDLLVALAATTAYVYSSLAVVLGHTEVYFDITVAVVLVVTVGNAYKRRVADRATAGLADRVTERVDRARRRTAEGTPEVAVDDLAAGDEVVVHAGERVPLDGTVLEGSAAVDTALLTGEAVPERCTAGDEVVGGADVLEGTVVVEVASDAERTLDRIVGDLLSIQSGRSAPERLADRIAAVFVPLVVLLAALAMGAHVLLGAALVPALLTGLTVLIVSCPCALGLATPLAIAAGLRAGLDRGLVLTDETVFERLQHTDVVVFDKTGTLTTGEMSVREVTVTDGVSRAEVLDRAGALEQFADHPVAAAIDVAADSTHHDAVDVSTLAHRPGVGVTGTVAGAQVRVGAPTLFDDWAVPEVLAQEAATVRADGDLVALVGWDGRATACIRAGDTPRDDWRETVAAVVRGGREVVVLTGDSEVAAARYREVDAIADVFAGVPPEGKAAVIERLRADRTVAMVGDGTNDAPALAAADVGIAMGSGTAVAADAADVVATDDDLDAILDTLALTATTRRRIRQNLGWAFLYNAVALPLAAMGLLNPLFAALAMGASSLLVVVNAARSMADDGEWLPDRLGDGATLADPDLAN
jgi:Cu2+-exporting ATPase